ncbi:restriction endonuclease subunit S [Salinicola sp. CR57]|uniref:restriction endonuclease subunit S n=1 Tax=Salinicola sp. CR57 TaxID=1949086 RepID=UPI0018E4FFAD|nr:restriction endonuclease subunit S [Salinicola sp. CR57]
MMLRRELPIEWSHAQLGDVVAYGKTQKCVLSDVSDDTWVLELEDVEKENSRIIARKTAAERPFKSSKNLFKKGDVLYGKLRPYLSKVVLANAPGVCTTEIIPMDAEPFVLNCYLFYWLKTHDFLSYVTEVSYGVNMPRLGTKDGVVAPIVLAPLAEQKVIADRLDTLLAQVESAKARLERIPEILNRFRQSVLAAAVSGRLTEEWRLKAEKKLEPLKKIGDIAKVVRGGSPRPAGHPDYFGGDIPWITVKEVTKDKDKILRTTSSQVTELGKERSRYIEAGTLLLTNSGATLGVPKITEIAGCINDGIVAIQNIEEPLKGYLYYNLLSMTDSLRRLNQGAAQPNLNTSIVKAIEVILPLPDEQTEIVRRVDQLFAYADTVERQVNNALARVNQLTQSILAKAFRGELTAQWRTDNPELISGENSAEALLARIKAERAAQAPQKRTRKKANA